ncbi:MAG: RHS repeat-associated core domain-containing protein [Coriobacteriia bacterium]|nr:RHS repeat-associated core domain-containing protein [Coriobacteriia bacterium]
MMGLHREIRGVSHSRISAHRNELRTYVYDEVGRLIKSKSTVNGTNIYGWDKAGNRRFASEDGEEVWAVFNGLNQLTEKHTDAGTIVYSYCANGNQIREVGAGIDRSFTYNSDNCLTEVRDSGTLINANAYRSDGQRISKYEHGTTIYYTYLDGTVLYTTDIDNSPDNFHLTTPDGQLIAWQHFNTNSTHFSGLTTDIRQSTSTVLGENGSLLTGFRYTDFGETTKLSSTDELIEIAYTGGVRDSSTGLYYLNARFYNPVDARFLTLDVARNGGDLRATLSLYGYCEGDPINKVDPSGYTAIAIPVGAGASGIIKAAKISAGAVVVIGGGTWILSTQLSRVRSRNRNAHYFRARLSDCGRHVVFSTRITRGQATTRVRNGNDILTTSRSRAQRVARNASGIGRAVRHAPHRNRTNINPLQHFHPVLNNVRRNGNFVNLGSHAWWH